METIYYINPTMLKNFVGHYQIAKELLNNLYKQKFNKKKVLLKDKLSFWSSFVNKKYIINNYDEMEILRKEIELVAEFKLEECKREYIIRQRFQ